MNGTDVASEISVRIRAKEPIIVLESFEEDRMIAMLERVAADLNRDLYVWTWTKGILNVADGKPLPNSGADPLLALDAIEAYSNDTTTNAAIFVLHDFHAAIEGDTPQSNGNPLVIRKLRDIHASLKDKAKSIIITTPHMRIPTELQKIIPILDMPYPTAQELGEALDASMQGPRDALEEYRGRLESLKESLKQAEESKDDVSIQSNTESIKIVKAKIATEVKVLGDFNCTTMRSSRRKVLGCRPLRCAAS
jgi:hypothetical protein